MIFLSLTLLTFAIAGPATHPSEQRKARWKPDRTLLAKEGGLKTDTHVKHALTWLLKHQNEAGYWGGATYVEECKRHGAGACDGSHRGSEGGAGSPRNDVGLTGLAALALAGADSTVSSGEFAEPLMRAARWLASRQEASGRIGSDGSHDFLYGHIIATYALCEAIKDVDDAELRKATQSAIDYILRARAPYAAWRYDVPSIGDNDTSMTAWAMTALVSGMVAGFEVPSEALDGGIAWIEQCMGEERIGYDTPNSVSARTQANEAYERTIGEAMTGAGLWCLSLRGTDTRSGRLLKYVLKLLDVPPRWVDEGLGNDMYYWYYGTYAMFQVGGEKWSTWNTTMKEALMDSQHKKGPVKGSWDPIGPWGYVGGRVYATALNTLTLQVYYRYPRFRE